MNKFLFQKYKDSGNEIDCSDVTFQVVSSNLESILEEFRLFLNACGYTYVDHIYYDSQKRNELLTPITKKLHNDLVKFIEKASKLDSNVEELKQLLTRND